MQQQTATVIRLAIDLDGVLSEHPALLARAANDEFNLVLPDSAFVDSAGHAVTMTVREWVYSPNGPAANMVPNPLARDFLKRVTTRLGRENVCIVTARPAMSELMTLGWLARQGLDLCDVYFADDKVRAARELGITHAVEDSIRHAKAYAAAGVTCYFLPIGLAIRPKGITHQVVDLAEVAARLFDEQRASTPAPRSRIVVSDQIAADARARLADEADIVDVVGTDVAALHAALAEADALVVRSETIVDAAAIAAAPRLRVVARAGVGVDNIDVAAATRAGVLVLNAPGANAVSAAEHTVALLLAISRQLVDANATLHDGRWERKRYQPFDLKAKTAGIVGLGRVGSLVARRLAAFEMRLIGHDPYVPEERFAELGVERVPYDELLAQSDVVTFHAPSTDQTRGMLRRETFPLLKRGAIVINAARGDVVDEQALAEALDAGIVAAAGVDVFPHEPVTHSPLWGRANVVLTPHIGGSSREALAAVGDVISRTTIAALRGEAVPNAVNLPAASLAAGDLEQLTRVAGAAGHLLGVLGSQIPLTVTLTVRGSIPAEVTEHVFVAAMAEGLQHWTTARVTPVNARLVAAESRIEARVVHDDSRKPASNDRNAVEFAFEIANEIEHHVTVRWENGTAGIVEVDRFSLDRPLVGDVLITHHRDRPGMIGRIGVILGQYEVNIAGMQVGRHHRGGEAIMVLNVDDAIPREALDEIMEIDDVNTAFVVSLPNPDPTWVQEPLARRLAVVG
ncbi:MAG: phosphoglycerate dehydrogenase [Chloroflexota bacterium]|nr:phosphoglycerate dehydrogenase [Chloroflexota bacterium]